MLPGRPGVGRCRAARRGAGAGQPGRREEPTRHRGSRDGPAGGRRGRDGSLLRQPPAGSRLPRSPRGCAAPEVQATLGGLDPVWRDEVDRRRFPPPAVTPRAGRSRTRWRPVLRGCGPGAAGRRSSDAARPRQRAVVRRGDLVVPHLLPRPAAARSRAARGDAARRRRTGRRRARRLGRPSAGVGDADRPRARAVRRRRTPRGWPRRCAAVRSRTRSGGCWPRSAAGFPLHVVEAIQLRSAADRYRRGIWPPCCATGSARRARRRRRSPRSPPRSAGTSRSICSPWPPTWRPTVSSRRSTSCGAAGYCASTATAGRATTSPTTCCATPPTPGSARRRH